MTRIRLSWLLPLVLAPVACSDGAPVDLGHGQALLSDFAASWDGYAEAYTFADGSSDRMRIVLDATGEGTLEVGDAPLDLTPTDPNVPLPSTPGHLHDGFRYQIHAATVEAGRIRFEIEPETRWVDWCAIQVPYASTQSVPYRTESPPGYICVDLASDELFFGNDGGCVVWQRLPDSGGLVNPMPVDCNRYDPCVNGICACTASSCAYTPWVPVGPTPAGSPPRPAVAIPERVDVDGVLADDGASLVGTLVIRVDSLHPEYDVRVTIRLQRQ